jgi:hypothetical protein
VTASAAGRGARGRLDSPADTAGGAGNVVTLPNAGEDIGRPVPGSPGWSYEPGRGLWRNSNPVITWCPIVERHLAAFSPRGEITSRQVTVRVGDQVATVPIPDIADGSVWASKFPGAVGVASREVREALRNAIDDQASRIALSPMHPRWDDGRLCLPPTDVLPRGYAEVAGTAEEWRAALREVARSPRMALVMGLALGGLFIGPLGRQSYMVHLPGGSSEGKTTTMRASASVFGRPGPEGVVLPWSVTKQGPGAWLRSMAILTGFRDELGAGGFGPGALESSVFGWMQGAERDMSGREGSYRETQGTWHGALMSSGNESVVGQITNEGIAARVIEIPAPLTIDANHADAVDVLVQTAYGHGLMSLVDGGPSPREFGDVALKQLDALGRPSGGVVRRLAEHLSLGMAGAVVLGELAGEPAFAVGVLDAAAGVLGELGAGLSERGMRPGDRLLSAIAGSMASMPAAWPTRAAYANAIQTERVPREVFGWDISADPGVPGDVAVIMSQLRKIAADAGISDSGIALRELRKRGLLHDQGDGRHLSRRVTVNGKKPWAYAISGVEPAEGEDAERPTDPTPEPPGPAPVPTSGPTSVPTSDQARSHSSHNSGAQVKGERESVSAPDPAALAGMSDDQLAAALGAALDDPDGAELADRITAEFDRRDAARPAESAVEAPAAPVPTEGTPEAVPAPQRGVQRAPRGAARPVRGRTYLSEYLVGAGWPDATGEELDAAEALWHEVARGIKFRGPFRTAERILNGGLQHDSIPALTELPGEALAPVMGGRRWQSLTWVDTEGEPLVLGSHLGAWDVNGMFPSCGNVELGGNADRGSEVPELSGPLPDGWHRDKAWTTRPGWVHIADAPTGLPYGLDGRIIADQWVPIPIAWWLADRDQPLSVDQVLSWPKHRRWLGPHYAMYRDGRNVLQHNGTRVGRMVMYAWKQTFNRLFGGALRSQDYNPGATLRRDWAEMVIGTAQARLFRKLDMTSNRFVGVQVDAVWMVVDGPDGVPVEWTTGRDPVINPTKLGKLKPAGHATVTKAIAEAHRTGMWKPIYRALKGVDD